MTHNIGSKPIVIGEVDDDGNVINEIRVMPGEKIPEEWQEKISTETLFIGHRDGSKVGDKEEVKHAFDYFKKYKDEKAN